MRINNNLMANNAYRQYSVNNSNVAGDTEKLSSGKRINRAGDDAAGLVISEKMRNQIRGLQQASANSQDAISLVQTAEGALTEVHSMLQRMGELANQAATGTNENVDREAINSEFQQLKDEIDDIADQTTFNNMKVLSGAFGAAKATVDFANSDLTKGKSITGTTGVYSVFENIGMTASKAGTFAIDLGSYADGKFTGSGAATGAEEYLQITFTDATTQDVTNTVIKIADVLQGEQTDGKSFVLNLGAAGLGTYAIAAADGTGVASKADFLASLDSLEVATTAPAGDSTDNSIMIQVGALEGEQLSLGIDNMDSDSLGLSNASIALQDDAGKAISLVTAAINTVSTQRASLGALQNRLEHKINNLNTSAENMQAAESRISDLDIAKGMTEFTKDNILAQTSTSMLAQANQLPQNVLKLVQ